MGCMLLVGAHLVLQNRTCLNAASAHSYVMSQCMHTVSVGTVHRLLSIHEMLQYVHTQVLEYEHLPGNSIHDTAGLQ